MLEDPKAEDTEREREGEKEGEAAVCIELEICRVLLEYLSEYWSVCVSSGGELSERKRNHTWVHKGREIVPVPTTQKSQKKTKE